MRSTSSSTRRRRSSGQLPGCAQARGGVLTSAVSKPVQEEAARRGVEAGFFLVEVNTADLERIASMVGTSELITQIGTVRL